MKGLLIKDLRLMLGQKRFFILFIFIAIMLNFNADSGRTFVVGYMTFVCSVFALSTISYDENENGYSFLMTLPVMRKTYAREKYVFGLLMSSSAWVVAVVISVIFYVVRMDDILSLDLLVGAAAFIPAYIVQLAVMLPLQLQFGGEKGKIAMLLAFGIALFAVYFAVRGLQMAGMDVEKLIKDLSVMQQGVLVLLCLAISIVVLLVSVMISGRIMCRKEF